MIDTQSLLFGRFTFWNPTQKKLIWRRVISEIFSMNISNDDLAVLGKVRHCGGWLCGDRDQPGGGIDFLWFSVPLLSAAVRLRTWDGWQCDQDQTPGSRQGVWHPLTQTPPDTHPHRHSLTWPGGVTATSGPLPRVEMTQSMARRREVGQLGQTTQTDKLTACLSRLWCLCDQVLHF